MQSSQCGRQLTHWKILHSTSSKTFVCWWMPCSGQNWKGGVLELAPSYHPRWYGATDRYITRRNKCIRKLFAAIVAYDATIGVKLELYVTNSMRVNRERRQSRKEQKASISKPLSGILKASVQLGFIWVQQIGFVCFGRGITWMNGQMAKCLQHFWCTWMLKTARGEALPRALIL